MNAAGGMAMMPRLFEEKKIGKREKRKGTIDICLFYSLVLAY